MPSISCVFWHEKEKINTFEIPMYLISKFMPRLSILTLSMFFIYVCFLYIYLPFYLCHHY